jgi:hypothetical protein
MKEGIRRKIKRSSKQDTSSHEYNNFNTRDRVVDPDPDRVVDRIRTVL